MSRALLVLHSDAIRNKAADSMTSRVKICENCPSAFYKDVRYSIKYWQRQRHCSQQCAGQSRKRRCAATRAPIEQIFHAKYKRDEGCWNWTGSKDKDGYGVFFYKKKGYRANKLALQFAGNPVPDGYYACHKCDNPSCVNPSHLYVGTPQQNSDDCRSRGRNQKGEKVHSAKLTEADVQLIRASFLTDEEAGRRFGVSRSNISMIRTRRTWKHVA